MILGILASAIRAAISGGGSGGGSGGTKDFKTEVMALQPRAFYRFAEASGTVLKDSSGNGRDGVYPEDEATRVATSLIGDADDRATVFPSADTSNPRRVYVGTTPFESSTDWTIGFVVRPTAKPTTANDPNYCVLQMTTPGSSEGGIEIGIVGSDTDYYFRIMRSGVAQVFDTSASYKKPYGTTAIGFLTYSKDNALVELWLDGVKVGSGSATYRTYTGAMRIGWADFGNSLNFPFIGIMDEITIFGSKLSAAQIATLSTAAVPPSTYDPYWDKVSLMLHGDATDVVDSSKNARVPTGSSGGFAIRTDVKKFGTGAIQGIDNPPVLAYPASPDFDLAGIYTLEFWLYLDQYPTGQAFWMGNSGVNYLTMDTGGNFGGSGNSIRWPTAMPLNTWVHLAACRDSSNTTRSFINGKLVYTETSNLTTAGSVPLGLFSIPGRSDLRGLQGTIDEFRFTAGVARYSGDFALQTAPFPGAKPVDPVTPVAAADPFWNKTTVLAHLDGTLANKSTSGKTISSSTGAPTFNTNVKKFGSAAAQPPSSEVMQINSLRIPMEFTLEAWICFPTAPAQTVYPLATRNDPYVWVTVAGGGAGVIVTAKVFNSNLGIGDPVKLGQFYHLAICRDAQANITLYLDGKPQGIVRDNTVMDSTDFFMSGNSAYIGPQPNDMLIDEFRFTEACRYAGTFTPPTAAYGESGNPKVNLTDPYWANVKSLLPLDGDFLDAADAPPLWSKVGAPVISTEQTLFGLPTLKLDGASALVSGQTGPISGVLASNEFTIEAWVYPTKRTGAGDYQRFISLEADGQTIMHLQRLNGTQFQIVFDASSQSGFMNLGQEPTFNAWNHIAVTRKENQYRFFLNGKLLATSASSGALPNAAWVLGGAVIGTVQKEFFTGFMAQFRATVGVARYTADFAVPTTAFPKAVVLPADPYWKNVAFLSHFDGANNAKSAVDERGATINFGGGASLVSGQKKFGTAALTFSGLNDGYVDIPSSNRYDLGALDFTIEMQVFWIGNAGGLISRRDGLAMGWAIQVESDGRVALRATVGSTWSDSQITTAAGALKSAVWTHLALTRKGTTFSLWLDGKLAATKAITGAMEDSTYPIRLGQATSINYNENPLSGCLDEVRITPGVSRYNAEFVPPAAPFAAYGPAATATKVTTGRKFSGAEYLQGDAQGLLRTTRTFFVDFTPDSAASSDKLAVVASTDYDDYGWPYVIGTSSRSALDQYYGKMGWYRRIAKENGQAVIGWVNSGDLIGIRQRIAFVFDAEQPLPGSFSEGARPGREVVNGTVRTTSAAMQLMSLASRIGLGKGDGHEPFKGTIRAVAFWDRSLTESEVNRLMTSDTYDLADFPGLSNAWLPENIADGKLANSAVGGSPMALVSMAQAKVYALRGETGLTQFKSGYGDDAADKLPAPPFPVMIAGVDRKDTMYLSSNSYFTFETAESGYQNLSAGLPAQVKLLVLGGDRSWLTVHAGVTDSGNAYTVRFVGGVSSNDPTNNVNIRMTWEVTFYKDGSIVLATGVLNGLAGATGTTGLASRGAWIAQLGTIAENSAYLFTPQDAQGNTWTVEKKA